MQLQLDFEGGLTRRYRDLMDVVRAAVERSDQQKQLIAAELDMSPSELARRLAESPDDTRVFRARDLPRLIEACGDAGLDVVYWLIERHLQDPGAAQGRAVRQIAALLPQLVALVEAAGLDAPQDGPADGLTRLVRGQR